MSIELFSSQALRKIITKHVKGSVIISIPLDNYRRIFAAEGPWRNPYLFLFFVLIRNYKNNCKKVGLSPETEFIFDTQTGAMSRIKEAWEYFANHVPRMLDFIGKPPSFQDDEKVLPLQAADMVAWWVRRQIADDIAGFPRLPFPWDGEDQIPCVRARYDAASLQNAFDEMQGRQGLNTKMLFHLGLWP
ncbi:DUF3800 domain-containing protein [Neorhizobium petrolearium]|uniref:DUF3800 domain-containing protein n=1 Tax=Neorhizobium petrolearium TaxID=515361 RepID=A0ABY8M3Z5_9HYPH|nr:DUF3800 domain-containing protein [Neorhizobium petrolearium]MCC2609031.1 DUF3800 domain-containing protein [Neorhizobium petrolearium]WGI69271.1 DUF3800 domain-containing protein [Neorhizobium petrolearium]